MSSIFRSFLSSGPALVPGRCAGGIDIIGHGRGAPAPVLGGGQIPLGASCANGKQALKYQELNYRYIYIYDMIRYDTI